MSSKKNKFSKKDKLFMEIALGLARSREGLTGTNPSVGCEINFFLRHQVCLRIVQNLVLL